MKNNQKLTAMALLTSLCLLGACGKKEETTSTTTNVSKSSQTTTHTKKKEIATTTLETTSIQTEETTATTVTQTEASSSQSTSTINIKALANNDFSSIAGSWSNDLGETITISNDGQVTSSIRDGSLKLGKGSLSDNTFVTSIYNPDSEVGGAAFMVIPGGIPNPHFGDVTPADRILIGQDINADAHPFTRN